LATVGAIGVARLRRAQHRANRYLAKLESLLDHAPMAIGLVDPDLAPLQRNAEMDRLLTWPEVRDLALQVIATREAVLDMDLQGIDEDGRPYHLLVGCYPVLGPSGELVGAGLIASDVLEAMSIESERTTLLERVSRLQQVTAALAAARTTEDVVRVVIDDIRRMVGAAAASLCLVDGNELEMLGARGYEDDVSRRWRRFPIDADTPFAESFRTGRLVIASSFDEIGRRWAAIDSDRVVHPSIAALPLLIDGIPMGAVGLTYEHEREFDDGEVAFLGAVATQSAQALLRARLYEAERTAREHAEHVSHVLQRSLLPPATPNVPGLEVATRFFALGAGIDVGGDFYDVIRLGRPSAPLDKWAVVIGDVRGKGAEAAAITGAARHSLRASALNSTSPAVMLAQLNELLIVLERDQEADEPRFCTAVVAVVQPGDGTVPVTLAVGGHPSPMVLRADGGVERAGQPGTVLGIVAEPELTDTTVVLAAGDSLVLYTDGVTERHLGDRFFDEDGLAAVLSRCVGFTAAALAERIETAARAFVEEAPRDDLAIVVVRVPELTASSTSVMADLPRDTSAPAQGRRFVEAALAGWGATRTEIEVATLLASELITNAVTHGLGPVRITVGANHGRIHVAVSDASSEPPQRLDLGVEAASGRGVQLLEALATRWGVDPASPGKSVWFELLPA